METQTISSLISGILIVLIISLPVLILLLFLNRNRKRDNEMRDLHEETNRLLAEIASILKNKS